MVSINYSSREVCCKIVYYGPGLSGKTTNLQYVHSKVPPKSRGDLISLATEADRTLYFDFLPIDIGSIGGLTTKFQLYTVPGQVFYNATRKLVLRGVDGLVFVADSQRSKREENIESFNNLKENLGEYGFDVAALPLVLQYNKRDLPDLLTIPELEADLNGHNWPFFEASAVKGHGVFDTLKLITKMVLAKATSQNKAAANVPKAAAVSAGAGVTTTGEQIAGVPAAAAPAKTEPQPTIPQIIPRTPPPFALKESRRIAEPPSTQKAQPQAAATTPASREISRELTDGGPQLSSTDFADSFEVPQVIGMQRSLKVKKKTKRKFSFFGLFRLFGRKKD